MKDLLKKFVFPSSVIFLLTNCSALAPSAFDATSKYLAIAKGGADVISLTATGKTSNDHFLSAIIGKDCRISRLIKKQPICIEIDTKIFKYKVFKQGKLVTTNNIVEMKFPSEIYDFDNTLKKNLLNNKDSKKNK